MKDKIILLMALAGLQPEKKGVCHGCGVVALQAFILSTEEYGIYIKRLEEMLKLISESNDDDESLKEKLKLRDQQRVLKYSDILAHLQTVKLFHSPDQYLEWSDSMTTLRQSDVATIASIAQSQLAEKRGGIHRVFSFSGVYTHIEMEDYLSYLQNVMKTPDYKETRCGLLLSSDRHVIMLAYDAANSKYPWIIDNDAIVTTFSDNQYVEIAKKIREIFTNNASNDIPLILCTAVYCTGDQLAKAKLAINAWYSNCKVIHQVTVKKAEMIGEEGVTWLFRAAEAGDTETAQLLLEKGADVNAATNNNLTPLYVAAEYGHIKMLELLLKNKAKVNAKTSNGFTALHAAAEGGYTKSVKLLLEAEADANAATNDGVTPLHFAVDNHQYPIVKLLLEKGADVNAKTSNGLTALHVAAKGGYTKIVKLLLEAGADPYATADGGRSHTPLSIAKGECAKLIEAFKKKDDVQVHVVEDNRIHIPLESVQKSVLETSSTPIKTELDITEAQINEHFPVFLQRLFNFFVIASIVSLGMVLSFYFCTSTPFLIAIAFTTAIVTAIMVKYLPWVGVCQHSKLENLSKESIYLYESSIAHDLLRSPLRSQISIRYQIQPREEAHLTNSKQSHYNRLSR